MSGFIKDENSLANGIPNRTISPETGSFGNATMTNKGDTSEGTNQDHESAPAPAAGIGASQLETDDLGEARSFRSDYDAFDAGPVASDVRADADLESPAQQIADGGDHFKHGKRFSDDERHEHRKSAKAEGLSDDDLDESLSDDRLV